MARRELEHRRTATSKTFLNDDNTYTVEMGGPHAHYQKDGKWEEIDCKIYTEDKEKIDENTGQKYKFAIHNHPLAIRMNNSRMPLIVNQTLFIPLGKLNLVQPIFEADNIAYYPQMWDGIDVRRIINELGIIEQFIITSEDGQKEISWRVIGDIDNMRAPIYQINDEIFEVLYIFDKGILTFDFTNVPIGAVIE